MEKYDVEDHHDELDDSNYYTRKNYLISMKQFMAGRPGSRRAGAGDELEEYFQYEKQLSDHIQHLLKHCR